MALLKNVNRISITTDLWKSGQDIQYMVVTGHFINSDWKLQKRILNFVDVPPPHSGVAIADVLCKCFLEWGIENKVATVTVDNVSYNDAAVRNLKDNFTLKNKLMFGGKIFYVRCTTHIINLIVQDGLKEIQDIIDNVLQTTLEFKDVFSRYKERDPGYHYLPTSEDWEKAENVCQFLEVFNEVTNIISGSEYPTSNLFLTEIWRVKEVLNEKKVNEKPYIREMTKQMAEKFDKYWGECQDARQCGSSTSGDTSTLVRSVVSGRSRFESFVKRTENIQPLKSDLDVYLEEGVYICGRDAEESFDALDWWKSNGLKFRILSKMATDILSIPVTTVASESAFNAGGRVIDPYRASLATETVQVLMCGEDWACNLRGIKKTHKSESNGIKEILIP
ncbi:hypothetical protein L1049_010950 [Liquidambar formosana]|uniref:Zinc finger BED domain-containing protein RICESLEEPER 2-like n=1 Tax=Liquidambar formosana TaxID=63359 RepID=A0AAP0X264_LIQFO